MLQHPCLWNWYMPHEEAVGRRWVEAEGWQRLGLYNVHKSLCYEEHDSGAMLTSQTRPSVSVNEALRLAFPPGSAVVAGQEGVQRRICAAQVLRGRPVSLGSLEAGELVIFSPGAAALLGGERGLARVVRDLAEAGAAAFAVFQPPSSELVELTDALATPLVLLPAGVPPGEVERSVVSLLLARDEHLRRRVDVIFERLLGTLIEEEGAALLAQEVRAATGKATYVFDPYLQLLAAASAAAEAEVPALRQRLAGWAGAHASAPSRPARLSLAGPGAPDTVAVRPLELRGTGAGFLCLLGRAEEFGELDERVAERAASVLAIELAKQRAIAEARFRLQGDFLDDLLEGTFVNPEAMTARARSMGYDLSQPYLVFVLAASPPEPGLAAARLRQRFVETARNDLLRSDPAALLRERNGRVAVLKPVERGPRTDQRALVEAVRARLAAAIGDAPVAAGIGRSPTEASQFPAAYREAVMALEVARALMHGQTSVRFEDLGVQRLLFQLLGNPELEAYRQDLIGALEQYDARHRTELAHTLEVFLACNGNHVRAARELHLHRNTLLYRLERARAILNKDLDDPETRLAVQLALKLRQIPRTVPLEAPVATRHNLSDERDE